MRFYGKTEELFLVDYIYAIRPIHFQNSFRKSIELSVYIARI